MSVQAILLDFSMDPARLADENGQKAVFTQLETVLKDYVPNLILATDMKVDGGSLKLLTGKKGTTVFVRLFDRGLVTVTIEYYKEDNEEPLISFKTAKILEGQLNKYISVIKSQALPTIKRCVFGRYYPTSDERLLEYDIDKILFDEQSAYQKVQIVHSKSFGNMLVLDDLQNISEADLIYTETLMQRGKEQYAGKEIVILGGGDGALLFELLKERPAHVWLLEIDELVLQACDRHLRGVCGDVLRRRRGPNFEVVVGDCMATVRRLAAERRAVDYVFGDLTDVPIAPDAPDAPGADGELWRFMMDVLRAAFDVLKPTGKFMTHGNGATSPAALEHYERALRSMSPPLAFTKCQAFVPSFLEDWIFYQITRPPAPPTDC